MKTRFIPFLALVLFVAAGLPAQVPQLINYQGRVAVDGLNFDGTGQFKFALVNASGTTTYWSNDGTSTAGSEPTAAVALTVTKGLYSVLLGDATLPGMTIVPATVFTHGDVHLRAWFNDGTHGFQLLTPDKRIAAVGYAMIADSVVDGAITAAKLADGAVTSSKIADGAVTSAKLAPGVVQTSNLADGAVGNAQLSNSAVTITAGNGLAGGGAVALGDAITLSNAGVLSLTSGGGIMVDAATGSVTLGSTATSANTASAIVARDASGNFSAGTITAALNGNASTATSTPSFTGMLAGDVTGTQAATAIAASTITGKAITGFISSAGMLSETDTLLTALNKLDGNIALKAPLASPTFTGTVSGSFSGPLTGNVTGNVSGSAASFTGTLVGDVTGTQSNTEVVTVGGATAASIATGSTLANGATAANTAGALVARDASGNFFAGTITASLNGNASTATTSGSATSFTGTLAGDVTGTQGATSIAASIITGKTLTGFVSSAGTLSETDTLLSAINKLDGNAALKAPLASPSFTGTVTATAFAGDGSGLTNLPASTTPPPGMGLVPAGAFTMGNAVEADTDIADAGPVSTTVSAFYMDVNEVTLSQWQSVYYWAKDNGYTDLPAGSGKGPNHPVQTVSWFACVKWCNARSEQAGKTPVYYTNDAQTILYKTGIVNVTNAQVKWNANGYRLPTEAEWEKAARGGRSGQRFPWGNTITQNLANYFGAVGSFTYDLGPNGYNVIGSVGGTSPATSPVGSFALNGYGLNDMAGNVREWCWDWYETTYVGGTDPQGAAPGTNRVIRGGGWNSYASLARCAFRNFDIPTFAGGSVGFRVVLTLGQ